MIIYRVGVQTYDIEIDETTVLTKSLMGVDVIKANFFSSVPLDIRTMDYVSFKGLNYTINQLPVVTKTSTRGYKYEVSFEGYNYAISEAAFLQNGRADFSLYTGIDTMLALIGQNLNRIGVTEWTFTNSATTQEFKSIAFQNDNCMSALQKIVQEFLVEFYLVGHEIKVVDKVGNPTGLSFEYKNGLKEITRINANRNNIITSLWVYGGTQNIPFTYRDGIQRLALDAPIQNNVDVYGVKEGSMTFDDIFPQRTGTVDSATDRQFTDSSMDFDLNAYLIPEVTAKIIFKTGALVGYLFDLSSYDNATKTFQIKYYDDPAGFQLPNLTQVIAPGDTYTIVDCFMPESYITAAEAELQAKGEEQIALLSIPRVTYKINPDWRNFKLQEITLDCGDSLTVLDADLAPDGLTSRIIQLEQVVINPWKYTITVADTITYSVLESVITEQRNTDNIIKIAGIQDAWRSRANWMNTQELRNKIFDPDGYFDDTHIRPLTIETAQLTVGMKGAQMIIRDAVFSPNFENNINAIHISAASLDHLTIDPNGIRTWAIGEYTTYALSELTGYYIYVRANKTLNTAEWLLSTNQYMTDTAGDFYYFLVGYLHSPNTGIGGKRMISLTYGQTTITGEFITTGRISSTDGLTFFDLNSGIISGRIVFQSGRTDQDIEQMIEQAIEGNGDSTQTVIDGGLITTGRIEVGSGNLGQGNAGISGRVTASPATDIRFWAGSTFAASDSAPFRVQNDGTVICNIGIIGGWHIASDAIYTGVKSLVPGKSTSGITLAHDGSIHAPSWYMNSDGTVGFEALEKLYMMPVNSGNFRGSVNIEGNDIWENTQDNDVYGVIRINYNGYQKGTTRNRITIIGSGKGSSVVVFSGIDNETYGLHQGLDLRLGSLKVPQHTNSSRDLLYATPGMIIYNAQNDQFEGYLNSGGWWKFTMHT